MLISRELSWLVFNERVMQEAQDETVPLLQRLRFLGIFSNNQDEFVKVRVANLERREKNKSAKNKKLDGNLSTVELQTKINEAVKDAQQRFEQTYNDILRKMEEIGIIIVNEKQLDKEQEAFCREYFANKISLQMVPLLIRKSVKLPFLKDRRIYYAVKMTTHGRAANKYAIIEIPVNSATPRFVVLPSHDGKTYIIFTDDIIRLCLDDIFFMFTYDEISAYTFKFTRDAELTLDTDVSKSILEKMEKGISQRQYGKPVRMVYDREMPQDLVDIISRKLGLKNKENISAGGRYHQMKDLMKFPKVDPKLEYTIQPPLLHYAIEPYSSVMDVIKKGDIFLNYPYHSFNHVIDFLREAAVDPQTDAIYITLYRTAERSKIINALINAAKNGKKVVALMELKARFDEEHNIESAEKLREAGVRVLYGVEGLKVHSKLILVWRREGSRQKGYVHVGTGNFNEDTAKIYSDFSLFTCNTAIASDAAKIFDFLENTYKHFETQKLLVSPYNMRTTYEDLIDKETENAKAGKKAYIYAKCNTLTDDRIIEKLYKASKAGVKIRLIVRGACSLLPGIPGESDNIQAISIVDKYLEHARLMIFCNGEKEKIYIGSADWMNRNLNRRVEVAIPVTDKKIRETLKTFFDIQWHDNVKARDLSSFANNYIHNDAPRLRSQTALYDYYEKLNMENKK